MVMVRTTTADHNDNELSSGYLPQGYESDEAATAHIAELQAMFPISGYDGRSHRWWARDAETHYTINYWWLEYPGPSDE